MRVRIVALECGPDRSVVAVFKFTVDGGLILEEYALVEPTGSRSAAEWTAVRTRLKPGARVVAVPAANLALTKVITVPRLGLAQREQVVRFEAAQAIPRPLAEIVWSWAPVPGASETAVELAAMKRESAEMLCADAEREAVRLEAIVARASALLRALRHNYPELSGRAVLAEVAGGTALLVAMIGSHLAVRLVGLPEPARVVAVGGGDEPVPAGGDVLRARRLAMEMRRLVEEAEAANGTAGLTLFVAGADAPAPETMAGIEGVATVERFDALRRVRLGAAASGAAAVSRELAVVVGAALAAGERGAPSLLPEPRRRENAFQRHRARWLLAAALSAAAIWSGAGWLRAEVARTSAATAALNRELEPWRAAQRAAARCRNELESCRHETEVLAGLARARTSWARFLGATEARALRQGGLWFERWQVLPAGGSAAPGAFGPVPTVMDRDGVARVRIAVTGCALDPGLDGTRGLDRVRELLREWTASGPVAGVEGERFDAGAPGVLRFGFVLVLKPEANP